MSGLSRFNAIVEKNMAFVTPSCLLIGIFAAQWLNPLSPIVPWLFAFMTFVGSLSSSFGDMKAVAQHPLPLVLVLGILHLLMPLVAMGVGMMCFGGDIDLVTGLILEYLVPTGVVTLVWVGIYCGNTTLTLAIIVLDTIIAPFVVPGVMQLLLGSVVAMSPWGMMEDLVFMIALPAILAMMVRQFKPQQADLWKPRLMPFSKLALMGVVIINSTRIAPYMFNLTPTLIGVGAVVLTLSASSYFIGFGLARLFRLNKADTISVAYNGAMRNISAGAVIAGQYFPAAVMFPVMIGTLFQQVLAAIAGTVFKRLGYCDSDVDERKETE